MSAVLQVIAQRYRTSRAGKRENAVRDIIFTFRNLLKEAKCLSGPERFEAIRDIETMEAKHILVVKRHRTDPTAMLEVRLPLDAAGELFDYLGESAPQKDREALAEIFRRGLESSVSSRFRAGWEKFCTELSVAAAAGNSVQPFDRAKRSQTEAILKALPSILGWEGESLMRFASTSIFGHSKLLESNRSSIEACLQRISGGSVTKLSDLGILDNERSFLIHGPINLVYAEGEINLACLELPARIGVKDIRLAKLITPALRCLTVENAAMLIELAKLRSEVILVSSGSEGGYANSATVEFLRNLPEAIELWHFGDSDPKGFDILRDLRLRTGKPVQSLHMTFRPGGSVALSNDDVETIQRLLSSEQLTDSEKSELQKLQRSDSKGLFEQESLGRPKPHWPFFDTFGV